MYLMTSQHLETDVLLNGIDIKDKKCNNRYFRHLIYCPTAARCKHYWNNHFGNINWNLILTYYNKYVVNNKVNEVYFKIVHCIYPTNHILKKSDLSESCIFCGVFTETIAHLFCECLYVRLFWIEVEDVFHVLCGSRIKLQKQDIIFYYKDNDLVKCHVFIWNILIIFGKCYIHKCLKWSERTKYSPI